MTVEGHIDVLTSLVDDETDDEIADALEAGADALAFNQSLWNLFLEHGLVSDSTTPDTYKMEKIIDSLYGEIAAMTLMFVSDAFSMSKYIDEIIQLFMTQSEQLNKANQADKVVPPEVVAGFRAFGNRLKNAKKLKIAVAKENS